MADKIVELTREPIGNDLVAFNVLYLYPVSPPIEINGYAVVLRPRSDLPQYVEDDEILTSQELGAIDSGAGTFVVDRVEQGKGETLLQVLQRVKNRYPKGLDWIEKQRAAYEHFGDRWNED